MDLSDSVITPTSRSGRPIKPTLRGQEAAQSSAAAAALKAERKAARDQKKAAAMEKINAKLVEAHLPIEAKTQVSNYCQMQLNNDEADYGSEDPNDPINKLLTGLSSLDVGKDANADEASMRGLCDFMGKLGMGGRKRRHKKKTHKKKHHKKYHTRRR